MSFKFDAQTEDEELNWFADLLWAAFPEAKSEHEPCRAASKVLTKRGRPVTPRAVSNWLRRRNAPHFRYVLRVAALAAVELALAPFEPKENDPGETQ